MALVYLLTNIENGKLYVGKTKSTLQHRWHQHLRDVHNGSTFAIHRAIRKYGKDAFTRRVLAEYPTEEEALVGEREWIEKLGTRVPNGYNLTEGGRGAVGFKHTEETKAKQRAVALATGRRPPGYSPPVGTKLPEETKAKMRASQQERRASQPVTDEFRERMRATKLGKPMAPRERTPEEQAKRSASLVASHAARRETGLPRDLNFITDEYRAKMSEAAKAARAADPARLAKPECQDCHVQQTAENTSANVRRSTGLERRCKECQRQYMNAWRAKQKGDATS